MKTGHGSKFRLKMDQAIAALLSSKSVEDAARSIGLDPKTLYRWLDVPEFRDAYNKAGAEAVHQVISRLQHASGAAGTAMLRIMADPNVPPAIRLRACELVLANAIKGIELHSFEARLLALEREAGQTGPGGGND